MPTVEEAAHTEEEVALNATDQQADIPPSKDGDAHYFGRFGTFFLDVGHETRSNAQVHSEIVAAIKSDSRVITAEGEEFRPPWSRRWTAFPDDRNASAEDLLSGRTHFHPLELSDPVTFEVYVPIKNQPRFGEIDDVPTDRYWAAWDGVTLVVIWKQDNTARLAARSAGHVVEDVLRVAAQKAGANLVVQACSPTCTNMFSHRDLRITQWSLLKDEKKSIGFDGSHPRIVDIQLHFTGGPADVVSALYGRIERPSSAFAKFKNLSRRIIDIEHLARTLVDELLLLDFHDLERSRRNPFARAGRRVANVWRSLVGHGDGDRSRQIIASLWLAMSLIESLRRDWLPVQRRFTEYSEIDGRQVLYDVDRKDDDTAVEAINTQFVRAAVEHKSARHDNRTVVWATAGGAIAGAVVAFIAGLLTSAGSS